MPDVVLLTCEHASNVVPRGFSPRIPKALLESHRGYDIGAKEYACAIAQATGWPLFCGSVTRLVVDLNRSVPGAGRIEKRYYQPFRSTVLSWVRRQISSGNRVLHLSCHSFTPVLNGVVRPVDVGILYDPKRAREKAFAGEIIRALRTETSMRILANAPYKGVSDGHVTALRNLFPKECYLGLELEVNQSLFSQPQKALWMYVWLPRLIEAINGKKHAR